MLLLNIRADTEQGAQSNGTHGLHVHCWQARTPAGDGAIQLQNAGMLGACRDLSGSQETGWHVQLAERVVTCTSYKSSWANILITLMSAVNRSCTLARTAEV